MIHKFKLPTIIGVIILLAGTFAGVFFLNMNQVFRIGASPEDTPKDVRISNITDNSATVSFVSDSETASFISWGENANSLNQIVKEDSNDAKFKSHSINLSGLLPNKQYFFKINSNGTDYNNNSLPWKFTTGVLLGEEEFSIPISGSVITASGTPVKRGLIYLNISGYLISTLTSDAGTYVFQIGNIRSSNLKNFVFVDENSIMANPVLEFSVQQDSNNFASAQINLLSAETIPPIIMGQTLDFRNLGQNQQNSDPNALLNLPQNSQEQNSKFQIPNSTSIPSGTSVILESIKEGEIISTDKPQFFGKGPQGVDITITVHSAEAITGSVVVPKTGSWSWTPPTNLSAGEHSIIVQWIDATGITRSLTRKFVVQAAEAPAFTASQSGTLTTPSPVPTQTIKPSSSPTIAPVIEPTNSPVPVPVTGELTPTLFLFMMSMGILVFSFGVWKLAEENA